jgi:hypothetical protein
MHWIARIGNRTVGVAALAAMLAAPGYAQTVRPVIVQYDGTARGKFELVNNGLQPLSVVLEPMSFTITENGDGIYGPLASDIHLKLSAMSFRIPPRQSRYVFYEARPDKLPAWFVIRNVFGGPARQTGVNIQLDIPHTVYVLQREALQRQDVSVESSEYLAREHRVVIVLANQSNKLGRVLEWQVGSGSTKTTNGGFPLLPGCRRRLEVKWDSSQPPDSLWIRFEHFALKEDVRAGKE